MADFHENMKAFTDRLKASIDDRTTSLASTHQATTDLLDAARMFMNDVAHEHEARAESLHEFLAQSHADRAEMVQTMRDNHREELAAMSDEMRRMLDENMKIRVDYVADFMTTSHADRMETAQAMRDNHRESLATMRDDLRQTLDTANQTRLETVGAMRQSFQEARQALATDLKGASTTWRQFASKRRQPSSQPAPTPPPVVEMEMEMEVVATPTKASRKAQPKAAPVVMEEPEAGHDRPKGRRGSQPHRTARGRASTKELTKL